MNWKDLRPEIEKADKQINNSKGKYTEFYKRQRMFWNGYKRGIGMAFKIFKQQIPDTDSECKALNIHIVSVPKGTVCVWMPDGKRPPCKTNHLLKCENCAYNKQTAR